MNGDSSGTKERFEFGASKEIKTSQFISFYILLAVN